MKRGLYLGSGVVLLLATVLGGNALAASSGAREGKAPVIHLSLCSSGPLSNPSTAVLWQGAQNGVLMALGKWKHHLAKYHVVVSYPKAQRLDDGDPSQPGGYSTDKEGQNGITCIGGKTANSVAYIGTLNSGAALVSEPELNKAHMLMISPANTNPDLTSAKPIANTGGRKAQEPCSFSGSDTCSKSNKIKWVTYYRTVTTDKLQGPAGADYAKNILKQSSFYVVNDATLYGDGLATYFEKQAKSLGMTEKGNAQITGGGSNISTIAQNIANANPSMVYCGCNNTVPTLPRDLRADGYNGLFMGGDALFNGAWLSNKTGAGPGAVNNTVTSVGPDPSKAAPFFVSLYKKRFKSFYNKNGIQAYDAPAYDAAYAALSSIYRAAKNGKLKPITSLKSQLHDRTAVVAQMHKVSFTGATGHNKWDKNGDTKNKIISLYSSNVSGKTPTWTFKKQLTVTGSPT